MVSRHAHSIVPWEHIRDFDGRCLRHGARLQCSQCDGHEEITFKTAMPPEVIRKKFTNKGWQLGRRNICPTCQGSKHMTQQQPKLSPAAAKMQRKVWDAIMAYFDEATGRYEDGWSDERIAKVTEASVDFVKMTRATFFAELAEPEEITALRDELSTVRGMVDEIGKKLARMADRYGK